jgi:hypothetical protein
VLAAAALVAGGCGGVAGKTNANKLPPPDPSAADVPVAAPVQFAWNDLRDRPVSSATMQGRVTVICFIATYDVTSQAQVRFLQRLHKEHAPRLNVALIVLEQPENRPLVEAYVNALELPFPVALADAATIRGEGPFRGLHHVPSIAILDRDGRERYRHLGLIELTPLEEAVRRIELETGVVKKGA